MPEITKDNNKKEFACGATVFFLGSSGIEEKKIIAKNILERFTAAEKVEIVIEYFIEGMIQLNVDQIFETKDKLKAAL